MAHDNWEYLPVLNACLQILFTIGLGVTLGKFGVFDLSTVAHAVKFVFHVALPCLVVKGLGIGIDFYSDKNIWKFIAAYLILRAIALVVAFASLFLHHDRSKVGIGDVAVRWLSLTWISTVILGIPILTAVMGDPRKGQEYGILAAISSFIFQLPLQLFFLECHAVINEPAPSTRPSSFHKDGSTSQPSSESGKALEAAIAIEEGNSDTALEETGGEVEVTSDNKWAIVASLATSRAMWKKILIKVALNPVLWGIFFGFVISLSTFGVKYLRPMDVEKMQPNPDYKEWLQFLVDALAWLGDCVSPLSLFAMGVWMQAQGKKLVSIGLVEIFLFMLSKLVLVPLLMVGLAFAMGLDDEGGRAAVLIATLPISMASFSLGKKFNIGEDVLSANVAVGTILMLPTVLIWNKVMDEIGLFDDFDKK